MAATAWVRPRAATVETMIATSVKKTKAAMLVGSAKVKRVDRRQEEEIVAQRRCNAGQQRWPQAKADRDANDGSQEDQIDILDAKPGLDQSAQAERQSPLPDSAKR